MPGPVTILMLRHGQSEWNAVQRWQGTADSPLTALGREQAVETAWVLAGISPGFDAVWASDLLRASETAAIIAEALSLAAPIFDSRLREAHAGEFEGLTPDEIERRFPGWLAEHRRPPSFEALASVVSRTVDCIAEIASTNRGRVLVIAHSGVIRSIIRHLGVTDERVPNLGGVWLRVSSIDGEPVLTLGDLFDPNGIVVSGIDAPGEDPGD